MVGPGPIAHRSGRRLPSTVMTRLIGKQPCITFVTLGELTWWAEPRQWSRRNREALASAEAAPARPATPGWPPALSRLALSLVTLNVKDDGDPDQSASAGLRRRLAGRRP